MNIKLTLFFTINLLASNVFSQVLPDTLRNYYNHANNSDYFFAKQEYIKSIKELELSFQECKPKVKEVILMIRSYSRISNLDSVKKWLAYGISNFNIHKTVFAKDSNIFKLDFATYFNSNYRDFYSSDTKVLTIGYLGHLSRMDLFFHSHIYNLNVENLDKKTIRILNTKYDSAFAIPYIERLIRIYNFPNASDLGYDAEMMFNAMIRHYHTLKKEIFDKALMDGKMTPKQYASIVDYFFNWDWENFQGEMKPKENFGLNINSLPDGTFVLGAIDDINNVDKRRAKIGLPPIWQSSVTENFRLSSEYLEYMKRNRILIN